MASLEIVYFPIKGRAEAARLLLHVGGVPFKNTHVGEEFSAQKADGAYQYDQVPIMLVDGVQFAQSSAIIRYCAQVAGLVPQAPIDVLAADEYLSVCDEFLIKFPFTYKVGEENAKKAREVFMEVEMPRLIGGMERAVASREEGAEPWLVGGQMTYADITVYATLDMFKKGVVDHIPTDFLDKYPLVNNAWRAVEEHEKVKEWNETHKYKIPAAVE